MSSDLDELSLIFQALAHPVRRTVLEHLIDGKASVSELTELLKIKGPMMTKHLRILEKAKLINRNAVAQHRFSQLNPDSFKEVNNWLEKYRDLWLGRFERLEDLYSKSIKPKENE